MLTFDEFIKYVLPLLLDHTVDRVDKETNIGKITAYWAGPILRIDIKPISASKG